MVDPLPDRARKGRGAISNRSGRFEAQARVAVDDGWALPEDDDPPPPLATQVIADKSRSVIARNQSPDVPFDRSVNPYRGCEHGCVYCFARPTHAFLGFSAGLDFETKIVVKHEVAALLQAELARPTYKPAPLALGTNTDPYQPLERRLGLTRQVLQVLADCRHPLTIVTKSDLVLRDLDILAPLARQRLARVMISVTTLDRRLARLMEPRAPTPARRLAAMAALNRAGVPCGVMVAPMIPALNDGELDRILAAGAEAGASCGGYVLLRLPLEIRDLFVEWLEAHFPDRRDKVMHQLREMRGGRDYDATFGRRFSGHGVYAETLAKRFQLACKRLGLERNDWQLDCSLFERPAADRRQMTLL
jgi:DNA repair photolyase